MEIIIGIVVIFVLLLCMGVSIGFIATIALLIIGLMIIAMSVFFIYSIIILLSGKKTKGRFVRSEKSEKTKIPYAVYDIGGIECKNLLPLEVLFLNKIYNTEKEVTLIYNEKKKCCFDNNAKICCILGIIVSIFLLVEMFILLTGNIPL